VKSGAGAPPPVIELDHLVVACRTLAAGRAWCEATFGVAPETGGRHALMATHNALLAVSSARFPNAYLELIAVDPDAPAPSRRRWFDLDEASLQAALVEPRLVHWVARTADIAAAAALLRSAGFDPGRVVEAERMTPRGLLRWRIALPEDGSRQAAGAVPLLIEWSGVHPTDSLPTSGVALESLQIGGVAPELAARLGVVASARGDVPPLLAVLAGSRGRVTLAASAAEAA
jgi:hypothetical protein